MKGQFMRYHNFIIIILICAFVLAIACGDAAAYLRQDKSSDTPKLYTPPWVIDSQYKDGWSGNKEGEIDKMNSLENDVSRNLSRRLSDKNDVILNLQRKRGGTEIAGANSKYMPINAAPYNVPIGSGTNKEYDPINNRMVAETINGVRHIYVGFDNVGYSDIAIAHGDARSGDKIIIKSGEYGIRQTSAENPYPFCFFIDDKAVSFYGGYDEAGNQTFGTTRINCMAVITGVNDAIEISGFTFYAVNFYNSDPTAVFNVSNCSNVKLSNSSLFGNVGVHVINSRIVVDNNDFNTRDMGLAGNASVVSSTSVSHITITNNRFNAPWGICGGSQDIITSSGNNFNCRGVAFTSAFSIVTSNDDYFSPNTPDIVEGIGLSDNISVNTHLASANNAASDSVSALQRDADGSINGVRNKNTLASDMSSRDTSAETSKNTLIMGRNVSEAARAKDMLSPDEFDIFLTSLSVMCRDRFGDDLSKEKLQELFMNPAKENGVTMKMLSDMIRTIKMAESGTGNENSEKTKNLIEMAATILFLENIGTKTDVEYAALETTKTVFKDSDYVDKETMKQLVDIVRAVTEAESLKTLFEAVDFNLMAKLFTDLNEKNKEMHQGYLTRTESIYAVLESLLNLQVSKNLDSGNAIMNINDMGTKRRIQVDIALRALIEKEASRRTDPEKRALEIYNNSLKSMQETYIADLNNTISSFLFNINKSLLDSSPASSNDQNGQFKAIILLGEKAGP